MLQRTSQPSSIGSPRPGVRSDAAAVRHLQVMEPARVGVGLRGCEAVEAMERLMVELTRREPGDPLGTIAAEHLATGGKRLRARLSLAALEAMGGARQLGVGWAAACELLHNATLIHDDLQDGDRVRRGRPSVWAKHGAAQAINAGDLLLMLPFLALDRLDADAEVRWQLTRVLAECATQVARGQASEIGLEPGECIDWSAYRLMVVGKTGALFQLPVEGAALLAGRPPAVARALSLEFQRIGVLFQLQDDVLDLFGDKGRESPGSDLREGKATALVIEHLRLVPEDRAWLLGLLATPRERTPGRGVREAIHRFRVQGALAAVLATMAAEAEAVEASPVLAAEPRVRELALDLAREVLRPIAHLFNQSVSNFTTAGEPAGRSACSGEVA